MDILIYITIFFYILSTTGYAAYFFLQKNYMDKAGFYLMAAGFLCHCTAIGIGFAKAGHVPACNLYETLSIAGWAVAGAFFLLRYKINLKVLGIYTAPLVTTIMLIAVSLPGESFKVEYITSSFWLLFHIFAIFLGEASFALACGIGILYLVQEHAIKAKSHGFFFKRLPSLKLLDTSGYACLIIGFTLLSIGLITGFVYAKSVWGKFWSWDPKEIWSIITWLLYAALLHERLAAGWRGRRAAIMSIIGFVVILFTFFGVNLFLQGHHGEFTKW